MQGAINKEIMEDLRMVRLHYEAAPDPVYVERNDANWRSQKTRRKNWRRLSNAPKAVRKRVGFRGHGGMRTWNKVLVHEHGARITIEEA